ncbi:MAG: fructose-6-phosphate aldolase [Bacteroidetes bacterium]|nr:fructose-6-phosphate aldolase [Bacteroidota bacterium]
MYIIKIKGKVKIPDYVQLRDDKFTLLAYFRAEAPDRALKKIGLEHKIEELKAFIQEIPFGKVVKVNLE